MKIAWTNAIPPWLKWVVIALIAFAVVVLLEPTRNAGLALYQALDDSSQLIVDLVGIGAIALLFAGLLAPLESLGWWSGWFGESVDTSASREEVSPKAAQVVRYVVYLDGIGQSSSHQYLPDIEEFLQALAQAMPRNMVLVRDLMSYSISQRDLAADTRPLAFFWRLADRLRFKNPDSLIGFVVNIRNILQVSVSADQRYGPIYNRGIAQKIFNALQRHGYQRGIPVTLIGYSGGGQISTGAAGYLKEAIAAPIDVISLGGVMSGNNHFLKLEHLYHFVGEFDDVQRVGPMMFPGRRPLLFLSYWNRARRLGKVTEIPLGPVGHNVPGGLLDPTLKMVDGRSALEQTLGHILAILKGEFQPPMTRQTLRTLAPGQLSNYDRYRQAEFNRHKQQPIPQFSPNQPYRPLGNWLGRLILPTDAERPYILGVWFEVHHADAAYSHLIGQQVLLRWHQDSAVQDYVQTVTQDLFFSNQVLESRKQGNVHPDRLNNWQQVDPLESIAGARPVDDVVVMLKEPIDIETDVSLPSGQNSQSQPLRLTALYIKQEPVQITGESYALVQLIQQVGDDNASLHRFQVRHYNPHSQQFDGQVDEIGIPRVLADQNGVYPSNHQAYAQSILNETGWHVYGAKDETGLFIVQAIAPWSLLQLQPDAVVMDQKEALHYMHHRYWQGTKQQKGTVKSVLLAPGYGNQEDAIANWQVGDRALVMHLYGGIGGRKKEFAPMGLFFGHFAYGIAEVIRDPLSRSLRFEIEYKQVYTQNTDGIIAGTLSWSNYMGDRQRGWLGSRPVADVLVKFPPLTEDYDFDGLQVSALDELIRQLDIMTARYRIGDGTGGTFVGPTNSCVQDAHQAVYAAIRRIEAEIAANPRMTTWLTDHPDHPQTERLRSLMRWVESLRQTLVPMGVVRPDWEDAAPVLGQASEESVLYTLYNTITSWRSLLPRLAFDEMTRIFLEQGASLWLLRSNQVGAEPEIEPIAPTAFWW